MVEAIKYPRNPVLIVDDEIQAIQGVDITLRTVGITHSVSCQDGRCVDAVLAKQEPEVVLLDLHMPHVSGEEILARITREMPDTPVIVITGNDDLETAVRCMKNGAFDYMVKPVAKERLISGVRRAIELRELRRENNELKHHVLSDELENPAAFSAFDSVNPQMKALFKYVESIAESPEPILITGETGVGKEVMARCVHKICRVNGPLVTVNVAGLDENAFSDTLFGHRKGAFTGAADARAGLVEKAEGGILFLDEIGDLNMGAQIKLLRLLQEREYFRLGSDVPNRSTARFIVATNKSIHDLQVSGQFRSDLFFRLRHHHIHIPPLRERLEDLPYLVNSMMDRAAARMNKRRPSAPDKLLPLLAGYRFPGNVRELEAMIHEAVTRHVSGPLSMQVIRKWIEQQRKEGPADPGPDAGSVPLRVGDTPLLFAAKLPTLKEAQEMLIAEALKRAQGSQAVAAKILGITRQALNRRLQGRATPGKKDEE